LPRTVAGSLRQQFHDAIDELCGGVDRRPGAGKRYVGVVALGYMLMPDHVPQIYGRDPSGVAFAYCCGYIQALLDALPPLKP
jgi:D-mannonate dehydratase